MNRRRVIVVVVLGLLIAAATLTRGFGIFVPKRSSELTLNGNVDIRQVDLGFQFGPSVFWPILSFGRIRAQIRAANARADRAGAAYEKAVLTALSDSEPALNRYAASGGQRREREAARQESAVALELARQRYAGGEDNLLTLLTAQSEFSAADQTALLARASELTALVALYKALGGGWEAAEIPQS